MFSWIPWWMNLEWRARKRIILIMCAIELPPTVAALTLFGIADPDTYRTKLWQEGANHGWNSSPIEILYAFANYKPIPVPTPWAQYVTDFNVAISVLSTFILIVKVAMYLTHVFPPFFSSILHFGLVVVWGTSIGFQTASDYSDPEHPSRVPWYLTHSCGDPVSPANRGYCMQAKGAFAATCIEFFLFLAFFILSVASSFPSAEQKREQHEKEREEQEWRDLENYDNKEFEEELDQMHVPQQTFQAFPAYPMSPQKAAFTTTTITAGASEGPSTYRESSMSFGSVSTQNKDLPLRHHITSDVYA